MTSDPRIEEVETFLIDLPTIRPHRLAMTTMSDQIALIVRVRTSDGIDSLLLVGARHGPPRHGSPDRGDALVWTLTELMVDSDLSERRALFTSVQMGSVPKRWSVYDPAHGRS